MNSPHQQTHSAKEWIKTFLFFIVILFGFAFTLVRLALEKVCALLEMAEYKIAQLLSELD